jgi:hypothetical protein
MAKQYKLALAIAIIRNKPCDMNLKEFISLLQLKFKGAYMDNRQKIKQLEAELLQAKQELYVLKNKSLIDKFDEQIANPSDTINSYLNIYSYGNKSNYDENIVDNINSFVKMKQKYEKHKEFIINLIKLKIIGKKFDLNENTQIILTTLAEFLEQIKYFFFNSSVTTCADQQLELACGMDMMPGSQNYEFDRRNENALDYSYSCILHSMQIFVNVFQVEWLYYLRSNLITGLVQFIEDLVKFILEYNDSKVRT